MQLPPLTFTDTSLLLVIHAIILLLTVEFTSPRYGHKNLAVNKKKLKNAALVTGTAFLVTVVTKLLT
jgi:hypothetical protein